MPDLPDRSAVRLEFAGLLRGNLAGAGGLVQTVYGYDTKSFGTDSPVIVVQSAGTGQSSRTRTGIVPGYRIDVWVYVLYAAVQENGALVNDTSGNVVWDEQGSEQVLDQIEAAVRALIDGNQRGASWKTIDYAQDSAAVSGPVGDQSYRQEHIALLFKTF